MVPTAFDLAGIKVDYKVDGTSMLPVLKGNDKEHMNLFTLK